MFTLEISAELFYIYKVTYFIDYIPFVTISDEFDHQKQGLILRYFQWPVVVIYVHVEMYYLIRNLVLIWLMSVSSVCHEVIIEAMA